MHSSRSTDRSETVDVSPAGASRFASNDQYCLGWTDSHDIGKAQEGDWQKTLKDLQ